MKSIANTIKFLWQYLKYYKLKIVFILFCSFYTGIGAVAATVALSIAQSAVRENDIAKVSITCGIILAHYCNAWLAHFLLYRINAKISQKIAFKIRNDLFIKINRLPMQYYDSNTPGDVISNFTNDVNNVTIFLSDNFADLIGLIIWLVGIGIAIIIISWSLALITFAMIGISLIFVSIQVKKSTPYFKEYQKDLGAFTSFLEEQLAGQIIIDLFNQSEKINKEYELRQNNLINKWERAWACSLRTFPIVDFFTNFTIIVITLVATLFIRLGIDFVPINTFKSLVSSDNTLGLISILAIYILLIRNLLSTINQIPSVVNVLLGASAGVDRLEDIFKKSDEYKENEKLFISLNSKKTKDEITLKPKISFKNVYFSYVKDQPILKNISFDIKENEFIGIVGPTGSGKTTLINLLTKLYEINRGKILIDKLSISEINRDSLRQNISLVLQDTFLFAMSIKDNIKLGNPNATDEQVYEACEKACCHKIISELENGYDTIISNDSATLSKGQKQLIAIARAILSDAKIIVFDEATSSVDVKTEVLIHKAMQNLFTNRTVIMIAHSLATIRNADRILVIYNGDLIEQGSHKELLKHNGFYAKLIKSQVNELD